MDISVVIPCFNESQNIPLVYARIKTAMEPLSRAYEVVFVDDGSRDGTLQAMEAIKCRAGNIKVLTLHKNYGKDIALAMGFKHAAGGIIVTIDSDLQNYPEDIPLLLAQLQGCDGIIGWRKQRTDHFLKNISSCVANAIRRLVLREDVHDAGCGLRAFKKECLKEIGNYYLFDLFLMSMLKIKGYKVHEVIVRHAPRRFGKSKFNIHNRILRSSAALFVVWWLKRHVWRDVGLDCK